MEHIINLKNFDPNNIKLDEKSYKDVLLYYIGYGTTKDSKYVKINSINSSYLIFGKVNGYFEEINGNKYLTFVSTNESKVIIQKYEKLWSKIRDLIRSITKNSDDYGKKYIKTKFYLDDDLPLNKLIKIHITVIGTRTIFMKMNYKQENKNSYSTF